MQIQETRPTPGELVVWLSRHSDGTPEQMRGIIRTVGRKWITIERQPDHARLTRLIEEVPRFQITCSTCHQTWRAHDFWFYCPHCNPD